MATTLRYEVWASKNGEARDWHRIPHGIYYDAHGKQTALIRAEYAATYFAKVCVEEYDHNRDVYLSTIRSFNC